MNKEKKYNKFIEFIGIRSGNDLAKQFQTSEPTIKRYKSGKVEIPNNVILIIELCEKIDRLNKKIDLMEFERLGEKQILKDFQNSFKKVLELD